MIDRGFGIELEDTYGEIINKENFNLDWFEEANKVDFKLNDKHSNFTSLTRPKILLYFTIYHTVYLLN